MKDSLTYGKAGVDLDVAERAKQAMAESLNTSDKRVLNRIGAFASLVSGSFPGYDDPVMVMKIEEPGSKQKLAVQHKCYSSISHDLVNHLINDIIVMGAEPLFVQDAIICGKFEKEVICRIVESLSEACREQGCVLVGGETSEQPGVVEAGTYILVASIVGVVDRPKVIDGSKIAEGDTVLSVASNGLHTNGYSLVRTLMDEKPEIVKTQVGGEPFIDAILRPHKCYYQSVRDLYDLQGLHGMAHITGGGIEGNLKRILQPGLGAVINLDEIRILPVFRLIKEMGGIFDREMLRTFNMGVGMTIVAEQTAVPGIILHLSEKGCSSYPIGKIVEGEKKVTFKDDLNWEWG